MKKPVHVGEVIKNDVLIPKQISATELANKLGVTPARICEIVSGKRGMTANTAILLGKLVGTSAQFWMNLQSEYEIQVELNKMQKGE